MLKEHQDLIGSIYQFDGMMLFLPIRLEKEVCSDGNNFTAAAKSFQCQDALMLLMWQAVTSVCVFNSPEGRLGRSLVCLSLPPLKGKLVVFKMLCQWQ